MPLLIAGKWLPKLKRKRSLMAARSSISALLAGELPPDVERYIRMRSAFPFSSVGTLRDLGDVDFGQLRSIGLTCERWLKCGFVASQ